MIERSDKRFDDRDHIWISVDIKNLPSQILTSLATDVTDVNVLDALADCPNISTRLQVARNKWTSDETLNRLAKDKEFSFIREAVASHPNTYSDTLEKLAHDDDDIVRTAAAANPNTPVNALILMLFDPSKDVVIAAIRNTSTPKENVYMLLDEKDYLVAYEVKRRLKSK